MKKLLLVMLVPVLVLGVMGCGKVFDNGDPIPNELIGSWSAPGSDITVYLAGNHVSVQSVVNGTVATVSYRAGFSWIGDAQELLKSGQSGSKDSDGNVADGFEISFYDFNAKKDNDRGFIRATYTADGVYSIDTFTVVEQGVANAFAPITETLTKVSAAPAPAP